MPKLDVTIIYGAETNDDIERIYTFNKIFDFKNIPSTKCRILLHDEELESVWFQYPTYDPETDTYFIRDTYSRGLKRYDHVHHRRFFIALHNSKKFEKAGWNVKRKVSKDIFDPFSKNWDPEHFKKFDSSFKPDEMIQELLGEILSI